MKACHNNKYDITKTSYLVQVCSALVEIITHSRQDAKVKINEYLLRILCKLRSEKQMVSPIDSAAA